MILKFADKEWDKLVQSGGEKCACSPKRVTISLLLTTSTSRLSDHARLRISGTLYAPDKTQEQG